MSKQIILSMDNNYPFGECHIQHKENQQILIKQSINIQNKQYFLQKAKHFKKLNIPHSIQINSIFQNNESIQIYYEYVPVKFDIWMKTLSNDLYNSLLKQLYSFATLLSLNRIRTDLCLQNLGFNQDYNIKYFIDINNASIQDTFSPSTLKEKYYREIALILKSFQSYTDKTHSNSLYYSLRNGQPKFNPALARNSVQHLTRTSSLKNIEPDNKISQKQSKNQVSLQANTKKSALKSSQIILEQKIQDIKEKIQSIKEVSLSNKKTAHSHSQFHKNNSTHSTSTSRISNLRKQGISKKTLRTPSIDKLLKKFQKSKQMLKINKVRPSLEQPTPKQCHFLSVSNEDRVNKSLRCRTPKNSESPVQYLDIIKSSEHYVQDFLNVLQDNSQDQAESINDENIQQKQLNMCSSDKSIQKTQQSQGQIPIKTNQWKDRYINAIRNSKKLIDKMKQNSKSPDIRILC